MYLGDKPHFLSVSVAVLTHAGVTENSGNKFIDQMPKVSGVYKLFQIFYTQEFKLYLNKLSVIFINQTVD